MSTKTTTTLYLDSEIVHAAKRSGINMSSTVNRILKEMICETSNDQRDSFQLQAAIDALAADIKDLQGKREQLIIFKMAVEERERVGKQAKLKDLVRMGEAIKRGGVL